MRRVLVAGLALAGLLVTGCGGGQAPQGDAAASPTSPGRSATSSAAPDTATSSASSSATSAAPETTATPRPSATTRRPTTTTRPPATAGVPARLAGVDWERIPTTSKVVALTFDAGGDAAGLPSILATLRSSGVRATFFLTGRWARQHPDQLAAIKAGGHRLGNHTDTHPHLPPLSDAQVTEQVRRAEQAIRAAGADPRPFFRFPFGDRTAHDIALVNRLGYVSVRWTVDTLGWKGTSGGQSAASVTARVLAAARPGEIVLMHVGSNPDDHTTLDASALPRVISGLRAKGYRFVTLAAFGAG
ncbi:MAG TPA: polysaccharide deacetylase family protein [Actinomycetes bacterium]